MKPRRDHPSIEVAYVCNRSKDDRTSLGLDEKASKTSFESVWFERNCHLLFSECVLCLNKITFNNDFFSMLSYAKNECTNYNRRRARGDCHAHYITRYICKCT